MKKIIFLFFVICFPLLAKAAPVNYTVSGISASESADRATEARKKANKVAYKNALIILMDRLSIDKNYAEIISDSEIEQMVSTVKVSNEKIGRKTYSATMDIVFSKDFVNFIFRKYNITKNSRPSNTYIMIPVLDDNNKILVTSSSNVVLEQMENEIMKRNMSYLKIPTRQELKNLPFDPNTIPDTIYSDYKELVDAYDVEGVFVLISKYEKDEDKISLTLKKLLKNSENEVKLNFFNTEKYGRNSLFAEATSKTLDYIFKTESNNIKTDHNGLELYVPISGLKDYYEVEQQLNRSEFITALRIKSMTKRLVVFEMDYDIEDELVLGELERNNFYIKEKDGRLYLLTKTNFRLFK